MANNRTYRQAKRQITRQLADISDKEWKHLNKELKPYEKAYAAGNMSMRDVAFIFKHNITFKKMIALIAMDYENYHLIPEKITNSDFIQHLLVTVNPNVADCF